MKLSARTKYGVRLMVELALKFGKGPVFLRDIAKKEEISEKYLSQIVIPLKAKGLINSYRGAYGGYTLSRSPSEITIKEIVEILEGNLTLVECVENPAVCKRVCGCVSRTVWIRLKEKISETLSSINLDDLIKLYKEKKEKILMYNI
jgi:Rrf2 family protein